MKIVIRDQKPEETREVWLERRDGGHIQLMTEINGQRFHIAALTDGGRLYLHAGLPEDAGFTLDPDGCIEILT